MHDPDTQMVLSVTQTIMHNTCTIMPDILVNNNNNGAATVS